MGITWNETRPANRFVSGQPDVDKLRVWMLQSCILHPQTLRPHSRRRTVGPFAVKQQAGADIMAVEDSLPVSQPVSALGMLVADAVSGVPVSQGAAGAARMHMWSCMAGAD